MKNIENLYKHFAILTFMIVLTSCGENAFETTIEIDPPEHTPQLVVHAYASTNDGDINIQVSESKGILDNTQPENISNASVTIWSGTELLITVPEASNSSFRFNYVLKDSGIQFEPETEYRIEVVADNYPKVIGRCLVPATTMMDEIRYEEDGPTIDDSDNNSELELDFRDTPGIENFYEIVALLYNENGNGPSYYSEVFTDSFDPATESGINYAALIMNDSSFDGDAKNVSVIIDKVSPQDAQERLFLSWRCTTEDHYLFNRTASAQNDQDGNPFASPIQIFSNMENGIGIFSIVNEQLIKIEI